MATGDNGKTMACTMCHGQNLKGTGKHSFDRWPFPQPDDASAHRLPDGARNGPMAPMMKGVVAKLTLSDIVAITGYLASQTP